jgi:uncharacterized protein (DUF1697 family)
MTRYIALLRAVNVGGTGHLPMTELRSICRDAGFARIETYLASGNVVFESDADASDVKHELEARLLADAGKPVAVVVRTAAEMVAVWKANPFSALDPRHAYAIFLDGRPPEDALADAVGHGEEAMQFGDRVIFVYYPDGMRRSKLRIPAAKSGTARNMNTVARLAEIGAKP